MHTVCCNGCFDFPAGERLHPGHVWFLYNAAQLGRLVVLLNSDASVRQLKGGRRPLSPAADRAWALLSFPWIDQVQIFEELDPLAAVKSLNPDILVKGWDSPRTVPEAIWMERQGRPVYWMKRFGIYSTTSCLTD
jgi:D-beta-D-heptose 7-phosphate kinase/D-beta-D-heptose 1-phosphate adenosyltransferase